MRPETIIERLYRSEIYARIEGRPLIGGYHWSIGHASHLDKAIGAAETYAAAEEAMAKAAVEHYPQSTFVLETLEAA
jgi:hypothetical protein